MYRQLRRNDRNLPLDPPAIAATVPAIVYEARFVSCDEERKLDDGIIARRWATLPELEARKPKLRSPVVLRCLRDYLSGKRQTDGLLTGMLPLQQNVHRVLASADLV